MGTVPSPSVSMHAIAYLLLTVVTPASGVVLGRGPRLTGPRRLGGSTLVLRVLLSGFHSMPRRAHRASPPFATPPFAHRACAFFSLCVLGQYRLRAWGSNFLRQRESYWHLSSYTSRPGPRLTLYLCKLTYVSHVYNLQSTYSDNRLIRFD